MSAGGWNRGRIFAEHGTRSRYTKHRCRCRECRDENARYQWRRRHPDELWPGDRLSDEDVVDVILEVLSA